MKPQEAIEILKTHLAKSSAHKWKELEEALDVIESYFEIEKKYHDLHASLSD
jgi:hypothetical protein